MSIPRCACSQHSTSTWRYIPYARVLWTLPHAVEDLVSLYAYMICYLLVMDMLAGCQHRMCMLWELCCGHVYHTILLQALHLVLVLLVRMHGIGVYTLYATVLLYTTYIWYVVLGACLCACYSWYSFCRIAGSHTKDGVSTPPPHI